MFVVEAGAQSLSPLGSRTKTLFLAKWSSGVKQWSPRAPNFPSWSPEALLFLGWSPGALSPFGTLIRGVLQQPFRSAILNEEKALGTRLNGTVISVPIGWNGKVKYP